jgi:CRP-like cAMP-binding protein
MLARFEGRDGRRRLVEVLAGQELVQHSAVIANKLADISAIEELRKGEQLYFEGKPGKNELFFLLNGSLDLSVQDKHVAILQPGQAVGEFPIVAPNLNYDVTAKACEPSVVARVSEEQFLSIANDHPELWKNMAKMLVARLRRTTSESRRGWSGEGDITVGELISLIGRVPALKAWTIAGGIVGGLIALVTFAYKLGAGALK